MKKDNQITEVKNEVVPMTAEKLMSQAIEKGTSPETMEKLLALHREMKKDWAKEQYDKAMAAFQAECPTIAKTKKGYNYMYADLTAIDEQTKQLRATHGFSHTFDTDETEKGLVIYCIVKHVAGHSERSKAFIEKETTTKMNSSQQSGAAMTYGKRYAFVNAFGILTGDEDTDAATPRNEVKTVSRPTATPQTQVNYGTPSHMPVGVVSPDEEELKATGTQKIQVRALINAGKVDMTMTELNNLTMQRAEQILQAN